jgi:hypothetical protein
MTLGNPQLRDRPAAWNATARCVGVGADIDGIGQRRPERVCCRRLDKPIDARDGHGSLVPDAAFARGSAHIGPR